MSHSSLVTILKIFFLRSHLVFCHRIIKLVTGESRGADCSSPQKTKRRRSVAESSSRGACHEGPFCCGGRRPPGRESRFRRRLSAPRGPSPSAVTAPWSLRNAEKLGRRE